MVGLIQPGRLASALYCVYDCPNESTGLLFQFWSIQRVTKRLILSFTVLLLQAYEEQCGIYGQIAHICIYAICPDMDK